eukprot:Amastigsp_a342239_6.p2 type:complete len:151 gc:universal Amastigsp_a342239_6:166-618(+)
MRTGSPAKSDVCETVPSADPQRATLFENTCAVETLPPGGGSTESSQGTKTAAPAMPATLFRMTQSPENKALAEAKTAPPTGAVLPASVTLNSCIGAVDSTQMAPPRCEAEQNVIVTFASLGTQCAAPTESKADHARPPPQRALDDVITRF